MVSVCFVCMGNICRSPTAEGVMRHLLARERIQDRFVIDSAGTGAWHAGEPPDPRTTATAAQRGIVLEGAARQFKVGDFDRFDHVIAMDGSNLSALKRLARSRADRDKLSLFRDHIPGGPKGLGVPDPYYGGPQGFEEVVDLCEAGCRGLIAELG